MGSISINPGTGPVAGATVEAARSNMDTFVSDLRDAGVYVVGMTRRPTSDDEGRFAYELTMGDTRRVEVEMPGLPLDRVRFMDQPGQDIWQFPRLYIDGSSWIWKWALSACEPPEGFVAPTTAERGHAVIQPYEIDPADSDDDDATAGECTNPECGCRP